MLTEEMRIALFKQALGEAIKAYGVNIHAVLVSHTQDNEITVKPGLTVKVTPGWTPPPDDSIPGDEYPGESVEMEGASRDE